VISGTCRKANVILTEVLPVGQMEGHENSRVAAFTKG